MYDVVVAGVGGMGSAAADALAGRGLSVLGLDRFSLGHERGSSHGRSRIVRQAYFESPAYVPLLRRAYTLWDALPGEVGIHRVGCLVAGEAGSPVLTGALESARRCGVAVEALDADAIAARFPAFGPGPETGGVFEPDAGFVRPEATVRFFLDRARSRGADLRGDTRVTGWRPVANGVRVTTTAGEVEARSLVLTPGAWASELTGPGVRVRPARRVMLFFEPASAPERFEPGRMPTFIWDLAAADSIYGFPRDGAAGVKVAFHNRGGDVDPDQPPAPASPAEVAELVDVVRERLPGLAGRVISSTGCFYELSDDEDFIVGPLPGAEGRVVVAAGFSGHGFKFVPVMGEIVADLVTDGAAALDVGFLSPERFG